MCSLIIVLTLFVLVPSQTVAADSWPVIGNVEAQPLLAQVKRLDAALEYLGQPLPAVTRSAVANLTEKDGDKTVANVQDLLDPHCLAVVEIDDRGVARVVPAAKKHAIVEQGWRAYLIKVINKSGTTGQLRVDSPNARPLPFSPKGEVEQRWLALLPYTAQPLLPNLSGLGLEYTVVQVYSRDVGEKSAEISFRVEGGKGLIGGPGAVVREWRFAKDADGWIAENQCKLQPSGGSLKVTMTGEDPFFSTKITAKKSRFVLRFWAKFDKPGVGQVFWWTKERGQPDGGHQANFQYQAGRGQEYEVRFNSSDGELAGVRIDPGNEPGMASFDWISLNYDGVVPKDGSGAKFSFTAQPSIPVTFKVAEFDGAPTTAAFLIRDADGRVYPAQAKRLAPDFFFQPQVYRSTGETVRLPAGKYTIRCSRGPESLPEIKELIVGDQPTELRYTVNRWINPFKDGWVSGDHHIHAAGCLHYDNPTEGVEPRDMMRHVLGEDIKIGCCLTWGPCFDYQKRFFTGKPDDVSRPPYLLRYDVEVSGFGSHASGHLNLLNLKEQIPPGGKSKDHWPTLGMNTLRWAKKQGAICGPAHSGSGLSRFVGRVEGAKDAPSGIPHFNIPAYDGIGANEFIVDVTHMVPGPDGKPVPAVDFISTMNTPRDVEWTMWYHVLNCGYRVRASGETDFPCLSGDRVGIGRVYAKVDGDLTFEKWVQAVANGRSYVSDGFTHLMDFSAEANNKTHSVGVDASEIRLVKPGKVNFKIRAAHFSNDKQSVPVELIVNGRVAAQDTLKGDGVTRELQFAAEISASSWVAIRVAPSGHTNPFFVIVDGKPTRANKHSAAWCLAGVEQCWKSKANTYHPDERKQAEADYEHARQRYRSILAESSN